MPMIDVCLPKDALPPDVERRLLADVTGMAVDAEMRRTVDLMDDPDAVSASRERAMAIAWLFLHRPETYVAGTATTVPYYRFVINVPEGQNDDRFRSEVTKGITDLVAQAEAGRWAAPEYRVWVLTGEVEDGGWGAMGRVARLGDIVSFIAAEDLHAEAEQRLADRRRDAGRALIGAAGLPAVTA